MCPRVHCRYYTLRRTLIVAILLLHAVVVPLQCGAVPRESDRTKVGARTIPA